MMDNMNEIKTVLKESELKEVVGGAGGTSRIMIYVWDVSNNFGSYKSGDTPKYSVGERVKIKGREDIGWETYYYTFEAEITSVDGKRGNFCPEYVYTAKIVRAPNSRLTHYIGASIGSIFESKIV